MSVRPGFTLLEMLISVAIFSGLVVLILAVFVRTASSQARVNVLREKSEVARSVMSRITNDFQYIFKGPLQVVDPISSTTVNGFALPGGGGDDVVFVLQYPNRTTQDLVYKRYVADSVGGGSSRLQTLNVQEIRGCRTEPNRTNPNDPVGHVYLTSCTGYTVGVSERSTLPDGFFIDDQATFTGRETDTSNRVSGTGFLKVALSVRPGEDFKNILCTHPTMPDGHCYKVETILTAGGLR